MSRDDPFNLARFVHAQEYAYDTALEEIRGGRKRSHWMWFIFPQFAGLGHSPTATHYAIRSRDEAKAYLDHPVLGPRLAECAAAVLELEGVSAHDVFGYPDDLKLKSSMTLFALVSAQASVFREVLTKYFGGEPDEATVRLVDE
jgi:uncharacterized protein (DUF1810 family)